MTMANQFEKEYPASNSNALFNNRSSSSGSSNSLSLGSGSDTVEDTPCSSYYSIDMMKSFKDKSRKKEKVKEYLKELKTMVNHEKPKGSRGGTLSTLEHVVNSMRKIKAKQMEAEIRSQTQSTDIESGFYSSYTTPVEESSSSVQTDHPEQLMFVLSPWAGIIENISPNVKTVLGYPWDMLLGRPITDFIGHQDQAVLGKLISLDTADIQKAENGKSSCGEDRAANEDKKIYLSFRQWKCLERGFRICTANRFLPFEVKFSVRNLHKQDSLSGLMGGSITPGLTNSGKQTCVILKCTPLKPVYKGPQCVPEVRSFSIRHDSFCNTTDLHPNAIPLLGYLPQEFVNSSIFDYYHADDLPELYNTYQTLVQTEGKPLKSKPYRLRVKNGDYILVDTEWSAIMKPKTHEVKAVICNHTVMRGPNNPDVFEVKQWFNKPDTNIAYVSKFREKIKKIFSQNSDRVKLERNAIFSLEKMPDSVSEFQVPGQAGTANQEGSSSRTVFESSLTYEHLNYKTSIRRFLLSQPKTYSSDESEKKSSDSHKEDTSDLSDEMIQAFPVDFAIPKPPSYGSSIKVLVSEQEPREDVPIASPIREEVTEDAPVFSTLMEVSSSDSVPQPAYLPVTLTQEMLRAHTKMQEKLYVQQATKDNTNIPSTFSPMRLNTAQCAHRHKRFHSPEQDGMAESHFHAAKTPRTIQPIHGLNPSFRPMETLTGSQENFPGEKFPSVMASELGDLHRLQGNNLGMAFPFVQVNSLNLPTMNATNASGVQWPFYSNEGGSGLPFMPLYTPVTLFKPCSKAVYTQASPGKHGKCAQHLMTGGRIAQTTTSSSSLSSFQPNYERKKLQPTRKQLVAQAQQKKGKDRWESSDNTSSLEDTTSSSMYLLESDSYYYSSCQDEQEPSTPKCQHRLPEIPPWLLKTKWTRDIQMCYTLSKRKVARVLEEDRGKLLAMQQEDMSCQQLEEFLEELNNPNFPPTIDEESEPLLMPTENCEDVENLMEGFTEIVMDEQGLCGVCDPAHNHGINTIVIPKKTKSKVKEDITDHYSEDCDSDITMKGSDEKLDDLVSSVVPGSPSPCKSSDSADLDSTTSGNLTTSDLRSSEEAPSSLKESDSKEESDASSRDQKDREIFSPFPEINFFERIFVPLKLHFPKVSSFSKKSQLPSWRLEANFNKNIEVKYQLKTRSLNEVLESDQKILDEMRQPSSVIVQFEAYKKEMKEGKLSRREMFCSTPKEKTKSYETFCAAEMSDTEPCKKELRHVIVKELMGAMMKQLDCAADGSKMDVSKDVINSSSDDVDMEVSEVDNVMPLSEKTFDKKSEDSKTESNKESQPFVSLNEQIMNSQTSMAQLQTDNVEEGNQSAGNFDEMFQQMFQPVMDEDLHDWEVCGDY